MSAIIVNFLLYFYKCYNSIWKYIFAYFDKLIILYYIENGNKKNITFNYYLNYGLSKFNYGLYYVKIFSLSGMNHIAFDGNIGDIEKIKKFGWIEQPQKRKKIILLDDEAKPININLSILDDYKILSTNFKKSVTNLGDVFKILDIGCTSVSIVQFNPFSKKILSVNDTHINDLYE